MLTQTGLTPQGMNAYEYKLVATGNMDIYVVKAVTKTLNRLSKFEVRTQTGSEQKSFLELNFSFLPVDQHSFIKNCFDSRYES